MMATERPRQLLEDAPIRLVLTALTPTKTTWITVQDHPVPVMARTRRRQHPMVARPVSVGGVARDSTRDSSAPLKDVAKATQGQSICNYPRVLRRLNGGASSSARLTRSQISAPAESQFQANLSLRISQLHQDFRPGGSFEAAYGSSHCQGISTKSPGLGHQPCCPGECCWLSVTRCQERCVQLYQWPTHSDALRSRA
jgi:hypothetical protein